MSQRIVELNVQLLTGILNGSDRCVRPERQRMTFAERQMDDRARFGDAVGPGGTSVRDRPEDRGMGGDRLKPHEFPHEFHLDVFQRRVGDVRELDGSPSRPQHNHGDDRQKREDHPAQIKDTRRVFVMPALTHSGSTRVEHRQGRRDPGAAGVAAEDRQAIVKPGPTPWPVVATRRALTTSPILRPVRSA